MPTKPSAHGQPEESSPSSPTNGAAEFETTEDAIRSIDPVLADRLVVAQKSPECVSSRTLLAHFERCARLLPRNTLTPAFLYVVDQLRETPDNAWQAVALEIGAQLSCSVQDVLVKDPKLAADVLRSLLDDLEADRIATQQGADA